MRRVYLSFLGTNDYIPCIYHHAVHEVRNVRFVQEATLSLFCSDWGHDDRLFFLVTEEARKKNWVDDGHPKRDEPGPCEGLACRIGKLGLSAGLEMVAIPDMKDEAEMWRIFQQVFDLLEPGDKVTFDITHAFRAIPMLAIVVLNYAKVLKNIDLEGIYYGAFEVLGYPGEVKKKPLEERRAPIWDLMGFDAILGWSAAIDGFLKSGDAGLLRNLAHQSLRPILRDHVEMRDAGNALKRLTNNMEEFGKILSTCRGQRIVETTRRIQGNIDQCAEADLIPAFRPLLEHIRPRMEVFRGDEIRDGVAAARWCLEHNLVQQGFTILQETLITHLIRKAGVEALDNDTRNIVTSAVAILLHDIPREEWRGAAHENENSTHRIMAILKADGLFRLMDNISQDRNDLNHAGYNPSPRQPAGFADSLRKHLAAVDAYLDGRFDHRCAGGPE